MGTAPGDARRDDRVDRGSGAAARIRRWHSRSGGGAIADGVRRFVADGHEWSGDDRGGEGARIHTGWWIRPTPRHDRPRRTYGRPLGFRRRGVSARVGGRNRRNGRTAPVRASVKAREPNG